MHAHRSNRYDRIAPLGLDLIAWLARYLERDLAENPEAGDVIKGTGGLRKIRVAAKSHGKSGGARVIYYHFVSASRIGLLFACSKNDQGNLTPAQKAALKKVIEKWR